VARPSRTDASRHLTGLLRFTGRHRVLHLTWFAFFLTFVVWFAFAPLAGIIGSELGLDASQLTVLALCNVALTVPARVLIGMALDRWGPRRVYSAILVYAAVPTAMTALATSFDLLVVARLAASVVGAGFVVGIRMVAEWFPPREVGVAEGVYGGWGNFGSAAAALSLPTLAGVLGGWRAAVVAVGVVAAGYGLAYFRLVTDTPHGGEIARPPRQGALEVTDRRAVLGLILLNAPLLGILGLLAWRLQLAGLIEPTTTWAVAGVLLVLLAVQTRVILRVNRDALADRYPRTDRYPFRSVAILCLAYAVTFGSELAVVSMLPRFFAETFELSPVLAGATAGGFAFMNLVARPTGGLLSDLLGSRRRTLLVLLWCLGAGYGLMAAIDGAWPLAAAVLATMVCSFFVQAGEGATYAIVPLVKHRVTGQISGIVGAYGNIGALLFLTLLLVAGPTAFFLVIAAAAGVAAVACRWLEEPADAFADELAHERRPDDRRGSRSHGREPLGEGGEHRHRHLGSLLQDRSELGFREHQTVHALGSRDDVRSPRSAAEERELPDVLAGSVGPDQGAVRAADVHVTGDDHEHLVADRPVAEDGLLGAVPSFARHGRDPLEILGVDLGEHRDLLERHDAVDRVEDA
jgi:MFS transporter, NNP family, nitrate/nitrite transporter